MARIRSIKPSFFQSRTVAGLPLSARLTFIGLWTFVDDEGRGVDECRLIKAAVWPLDDQMTPENVEVDLRTLADAKLITRYTASDRKAYLYVTNWLEHQRFGHKSSSQFPAPSIRRHAGTHRNGTGATPESPGDTPGGIRKGIRNKEQGKEASGGGIPTARFEEAWRLYPRRPNNNKQKAWRAWAARVKAGESEGEMLAGTRAYAAFVAREQTEERFVKLAATFFGPDRPYLDDYSGAAPHRTPGVAADLSDEPDLEWIDDSPAGAVR